MAKSRSRKTAQNNREWLAAWRERVRGPGPWAERFGRLADDIERAGCEELEPMLEAFVAEQARTAEVSSVYRPLQEHLKACQACREKADFLLSALSAEPLQAPAPGEMPRLSFLPQQKAWNVLPLSRGRPQAKGLAVRFSPAFLRQTFTAGSSLVTRGAAASKESLLMADQLVIDSEDWAVEMRVRRNPDDLDQLTLCATIDCDAPLSLRATLVWDQQTLERPVDARGQVCFEGLPLAVVQQAEPHVYFEVTSV